MNPLGMDETVPRFSWVPGSSAQLGYELEVSDSTDFASPLWVHRAEDEPRPYAVAYTGIALQSRHRYHWRVRVITADGESAWSEPAWFEMGLLDPSDWSATWITDGPETSRRAAPIETLYFRSSLDVRPGVVRARAYVSSLGWHRLLLGQTDVTGDALVPRWTPLDDEVEYQVYDVTRALDAGSNDIGIVVSDGRYRGHLGYVDRRAVYGTRLAALVQVEMEFADGSTTVFVSDESWIVGTGRILSADPVHGERVDLRIQDSWMTPGGKPLNARGAIEHRSHTSRRLVAETEERVQVVGARRGTVSRAPSGAQIIDFGRNASGTARIQLPASPGTAVTLSYGEVLTPAGELNTTYLSEKKAAVWAQRDIVTLGPEPVEYTTRFTHRGFRYMSVEGLPGELTSDDVHALEITTPLRATGSFDCSDPRLVQLWRNARASMVSNYLDTATDCPTRERSGWTGEAQVFAPTASTLFDVRAFQRRYLHNVALEQHVDGRIPPYVPAEISELVQKNNKKKWTLSSAGWADVTVLLPWTLYEYYGDEEVLRRQYPSAVKWVEYQRRRAHKRGLRPRGGRRVGAMEQYVVDTGFHFGEWLRPGESGLSSHLRNLRRVPAAVATAYFAHSARTLARIANVLGRTADVNDYDVLAARVSAAWHAAFVADDGARIGDDRQDDYVRALALNLLRTPVERRNALHRLIELIESNGFHLDTGFLSTPFLLKTLTEAGRPDIAYRLLMQDTAPSWLYAVKLGATSIWEKWDGNDEAGEADQSQNHYSHGNVASFLHEYVAGLRPAGPGWQKITVEPFVGGGLTWAESEVATPYGNASARWDLTADSLTLQVTVPAGVTAQARIPGTEWRTLTAGDHTLTYPTMGR